MPHKRRPNAIVSTDPRSPRAGSFEWSFSGMTTTRQGGLSIGVESTARILRRTIAALRLRSELPPRRMQFVAHFETELCDVQARCLRASWFVSKLTLFETTYFGGAAR